jgi:hypothetical protein
MAGDEIAAAELTDSSDRRADGEQPPEPVLDETAALIQRLRWGALLLNLIIGPGLGHLALGRVRRGAIWMGTTIALVLLTLPPCSSETPDEIPLRRDAQAHSSFRRRLAHLKHMSGRSSPSWNPTIWRP